MLSRRLLLSAALPVLMVLSAVPASAETLKVVASFTVLADVVRQVGGDHAALGRTPADIADGDAANERHVLP